MIFLKKSPFWMNFQVPKIQNFQQKSINLDKIPV